MEIHLKKQKYGSFKTDFPSDKVTEAFLTDMEIHLPSPRIVPARKEGRLEQMRWVNRSDAGEL